MRSAAALSALTLLAASTVALATPVHASTNPTCLGKRATLVASTPGAYVRGTGEGDVIVALGKNARVFAGGGNDVICVANAKQVDGGPGNDKISFVSGIIHGSAGNDTITQRSIAKLVTTVAGGDGNDTIVLKGGNATVHGNKGNDHLVGGTKGGEKLYGDAGSDTMMARGAITLLNGGPGPDRFLVPKSVKARTTVVHDAFDFLNGVPYTPPTKPTGTAQLAYDGSAGPSVVKAPAFATGPYVVADDGGQADDPVDVHLGNGFELEGDPRDGHTVVSWSLDPGDGTAVHAGQGNPPFFLAHAYAGDGVSTARFTITDEANVSATSTLTIDHRTRPTVTATAPALADTGGSTSLPVSIAPAAGATLALAVVDWDDGTPPQPVAGSGTLNHAYAHAGAYTATVYAYDDHGGFDVATALVRLKDGTSHANLVVRPGNATPLAMGAATGAVATQSTIFFDASRAIGANGDVPDPTDASAYAFSYGDAATHTGGQPVASHVYGTAGSDAATVTVTFPTSPAAVGDLALSVNTQDATVALNHPATALFGTSVNLGATATPTTGAALVLVDIDPGDGGPDITGTSSVPASTHTYAVPGVYCPSITVFDSYGVTRVVGGCQNPITITAPIPVVDVNNVLSVDPPGTWMPATVGDPLSSDGVDHLFQGTVVASTGRTVTSVNVTYGDGSVATPMTAVPGEPGHYYSDHAYGAPGIYPASVTAKDSSGQTATATYLVDVAGHSVTNQDDNGNHTVVGTTQTVALSQALGAGAHPDFWFVEFADGVVQTGNGAPPASVSHTFAGAAANPAPFVWIVDDHGDGIEYQA